MTYPGRRPRRLAVVLGCAALIACLAPGGSATKASAAGTCTVSVPAKVSVTQPYRSVPFTYGADCAANNAYAAWDLMHPVYGWEGILIHESTDPPQSAFDFYDFEPLGKYTVRPNAAFSMDTFESLAQNTAYVTFKNGVRITMVGSRSGNVVTLSMWVSRYNPDARKYVPWPQSKVHIFNKTCYACTLTWNKTVITGSTGGVSTQINATNYRYYKAYSVEMLDRWQGESAYLIK